MILKKTVEEREEWRKGTAMLMKKCKMASGYLEDLIQLLGNIENRGFPFTNFRNQRNKQNETKNG